jgi:hypothetical protein
MNMNFGAQTVEAPARAGRGQSKMQDNLDADLARTLQRLHELSLDDEPELVPFRMSGLWSEIAGASTDPIRAQPGAWRRSEYQLAPLRN